MGCGMAHAEAVAYADGLDLERAKVGIGLSCRLCDRPDCRSRAFPPLEHRLALDPQSAGATPYRFETREGEMHALEDALPHWHEFYTLLGTAAGTLVGLLFVAVTVSAGVFSSDRPAPLRVFLSATVVHFSSLLVVSLILLAPIENPILLGVLDWAFGLLGVTYYGFACSGAIDARRPAGQDRSGRPDRYAVQPVVAYLFRGSFGHHVGLTYRRPDAWCLPYPSRCFVAGRYP